MPIYLLLHRPLSPTNNIIISSSASHFTTYNSSPPHFSLQLIKIINITRRYSLNSAVSRLKGEMKQLVSIVMPQTGAKSYLVDGGKTVQFVNPHQAAWLTHWTGTRSETIEYDLLAQLDRSKENDLKDIDCKRHQTGIEISPDNFEFSKDVNLTLSLKNQLVNPFNFLNVVQESEICPSLSERVRALGLGTQISHEKLTSGLNVEISSRKSHENVQKNESSADTDAMDMESFNENHLSGVHSFPTNKDVMAETRRKRKIEPSDINLEISAQPDASSSAEKAEPCMSRTQSLDMNKLHCNPEQTTNSYSNECLNSNPDSESRSRWIKRLKLAESSSREFFQQKSEMQIDKPAVETKQECIEIAVSHPWIQRWSRKENQKSPKTLEICELDITNIETDKFQKRPFASVAARALMGKALDRFPQCKLQKKEYCVVWDTKLSVSNAGGIANSVLL